MMSLEAILASISSRVGLQLHLDQNKSCAIEYGLTFELGIVLVEQDSMVLLHQPIQLVDAIDTVPQLKTCMELNAYMTHTEGASLGLDGESGWIVLARRVPVDWLDASRFETILIGFMNTARLASERLADARNQQPRQLAQLSVSDIQTLVRI